jgi:predicted Co/Zn/Cd cation transporter (cation efflux family)
VLRIRRPGSSFLIAANALPVRWVMSTVLVGSVLLVIFSQSWSWGERALFGRGPTQT